MKIIPFVTFLCAVIWIYQCIQIYMRIVLQIPAGISVGLFAN